MAGWQDAPLVSEGQGERVQVTIRPPGQPAAAWGSAPRLVEEGADRPMRGRVGDAFDMAATDQGLAGRLARSGRRGVDPAAEIATAETRPTRQGWGARLDAIARGVANIPTFGLADEFSAAMDAVTHPVLGRGAPGDSFSDRYGRNLSRERGVDRADEIDRPAERIGGQVAGAIAMPIGAGATTIAGAARIGAGLGAGQGFGEGEGGLLNRLIGAAGGGVLGGAIGGATVPVARGLGWGIDAGGGLAGRLLAPFRGMGGERAVEREATRRVAANLARDAAAAGRAPGDMLDDVLRMQGMGQPAVVADAGGEAVRGLARSAANTSAEARQAIRDVAEPRFSGQTQRIIDEIARISPRGPDREPLNIVEAIARVSPSRAVGETREALEQAARVANRPAYQAAYAAGDRPIITPEIERLLGAPAVVSAMRQAQTQGRNRAIADGFGGFNAGVQVTPDGRVLWQGGGGVPTYPNLQFWDYTYRILRDTGDMLQRRGRGSEANSYQEIARRLRNELDRTVPEFGQARSGAAAAFGAQDALEAGTQFVSSRMNNAEFRAAFARMSEPERDLFRQGFTDALISRAREVPDRGDITARLFGSPALRERAELALGPEAARTLEARIRSQDAFDAGAQFVTSRMGNAEARAAYARMSEPERDLFRQGFTENLIARVREVPDRREVANQIFGSQDVRERVELALGRGPARELEVFLRGENTMDLIRRAMGNSTTAQQLAELGMAGGPLPNNMSTLFARIVNETRSAIDGRVAERVGRMLASGDVEQVRRAVTMIGRDRRLMDVLREAESRIARVSGTQAGPAGGQLPAAAAGMMPTRGEVDRPEGELPRQ